MRAGDAYQLRRFSPSWTMLAVILGSGVVFLDSTVVTVALPRIGQELSTRLGNILEAQSYVYYGYLLSLSALLILAGALADHFGRKRVFTIGLVGFGVTSVLCGLAPTMDWLIVFRVLQGAAGALLVPCSLAIITNTFEGEARGRAFGIWAAASAATTLLGPVVGGALVDNVSWRAAFFINVPLILLAVWATARYMAESRSKEASGRFDWMGAILVALAVGGLTFGAIRGQSQNWQDPIAFVSLGAGGLATAGLIPYFRRVRNPLIPLGLFRFRNFSVTNISTFFIYGALYVTFQYMALFLQGTLGYNAAAAGLATLPVGLFLALFSTRFGILAARHGPRLFMVVGPALMGVAMLFLFRVPASSTAWQLLPGNLGSYLPPSAYFVDLLPPLVLFGAGLMVMVAPLTTALMTSVPPQNSGVASAINNAISRVGPQLAGALIFVFITASFYRTLAVTLPAVDVSEPDFKEKISPFNQPVDLPLAHATAARETSTDAFHQAMLIAALLTFAGAATNLAIRNDQAVQSRSQGASA
jgi:EmrB/QacA subfamily drug resistance transporter